MHPPRHLLQDGSKGGDIRCIKGLVSTGDTSCRRKTHRNRRSRSGGCWARLVGSVNLRDVGSLQHRRLEGSCKVLQCALLANFTRMTVRASVTVRASTSLGHLVARKCATIWRLAHCIESVDIHGIESRSRCDGRHRARS